MPIYDQGSTGICYAYAAIQLVDFWRQTQGIRVTKNIALSNPVYTALLTRTIKSYKGEDNPLFYEKETLEAGFTDWAIMSIKKKGMCRDDVIKKSINRFAKNKNFDPETFYEFMEILFLNFPEDPEDIKRLGSDKIWKKYIRRKLSRETREKITDNIKMKKLFKKVAYHIENGDLVTLMNSIFRKCKYKRSKYLNTLKLPDPVHIVLRKDNLEGVKKKVGMLLNKKPVAIGYCSRVLTNSRYIGVTPHPRPSYRGQFVPISSRSCGNHASVLIGKKRIKGKCHFLLRNTWGDTCPYDWKCRYDTYGKAIGVYIEEGALFNNILSLTFLGKY
jgi:hypothetical protein